MVRRLPLVLILVWPSISHAQHPGAGDSLICGHPIIKKAQEKGLNSLSVKQIPLFWMAVVRCKLKTRKTDEKVEFGHLFRQKQNENFENSREISGPGTCVLTVAGVTLLYYYVGYLAGAE